ncbi:MAG TPA: dephospho-CoA kinase [Gemmatimonadaceae bacterium]|nr:dephospho-CoA kinase [Gemmatimonadaceae bacterium]
MLLIGLTGNIASGKSEVARMLAERGATLIDADVLAREAVRPETQALKDIVKRWGKDVLKKDGSLDRTALRQIVFADQNELDALNRIVHPGVTRLRDREIARAKERGDQIVVCVIPLLFERNLVEEYDAIVLVDAPRPLRLERLVATRGLEETDAMNMIASQMPAELKRARADYVIENNGSLDDLERDVDALWSSLQRDASPQPVETAVGVS